MSKKGRIIIPNKNIIVPGQPKKVKFSIGVANVGGSPVIIFKFSEPVGDIAFGPDEAVQAGVKLIQHAAAAFMIESSAQHIVGGNEPTVGGDGKKPN